MSFVKRPKPLVLVIVDGLGVAAPGPGNAVTSAQTKVLDYLWPRFPHCFLHASGTEVGLPAGTDGNSEVGHINIGAGKVVYQELPRIDMSITSGTFFRNPTFTAMISHMKQNKGKLHLMGCIGGGVVHSSINHIYALIKLAQDNGLTGTDLVIHAFSDGRDSPPKSAQVFLEQVEAECQRRGVGKIGTVIGRSIAMDRDERWNKVEMTYNMLTKGVGKTYPSFKEAIENNYVRDINDEYIEPSIILGDDGQVFSNIKAGDAILFFNYRSDRAIQLAQAFEKTNFTFFKRERLANIMFVGMTEYEKGLPNLTAFPPEKINLPLGRVLSEAGLRQLRISESEKYPHVTYFFDGGIEISFNGEDRVEVPSPRDVATYDQKPEMSSLEVTDKLIEQAKLGIYDFIVVNYANVDMVAHTGVLNAGIKAVQIVDQCIAKLVDNILPLGGSVMLTADHGNAEEMIDLTTGEVDTKHSTNPVPFLYISNDGKPRELQFGRLSDVAPTILTLLEMKKPGDMTGRDLLAGGV